LFHVDVKALFHTHIIIITFVQANDDNPHFKKQIIVSVPPQALGMGGGDGGGGGGGGGGNMQGGFGGGMNGMNGLQNNNMQGGMGGMQSGGGSDVSVKFDFFDVDGKNLGRGFQVSYSHARLCQILLVLVINHFNSSLFNSFIPFLTFPFICLPFQDKDQTCTVTIPLSELLHRLQQGGQAEIPLMDVKNTTSQVGSITLAFGNHHLHLLSNIKPFALSFKHCTLIG
jgi:hypothetical protein